MQKEIKLGIVVGFALLLAILLVWYKSGEDTGKTAGTGTDTIENLIQSETPAGSRAGETLAKAPEAPAKAAGEGAPSVSTGFIPLPTQTETGGEKLAQEVKPVLPEQAPEPPKTFTVTGAMTSSPPKPPSKPEPKPVQIAKAGEHKPATTHAPAAPPKPHEETGKEEEPKKEGAAQEKPEEKAAAEPTPKKATTTPTGEQIYVVEPGDNLTRIAGKFYKDEKKWRLILEANKAIIPSPDKLMAGMKIKIPAEGAKPAEVETTAKKEETAKKPETKEKAVAAPKPETKEAAVRKYTVKPGDNLTSIARDQYDDENMVDKILAANKTIKDKDKLYVGQVIILPPK